VSTTQTILLGAVAGFTIYLGLPLGRVRVANLRTKAFLNATSAGILVFLLFEILAHATGPVEEALEEAAEGKAAWGQFAALGLVYAIGFGAGLLGLLYLARIWRRPTPPGRSSIGPGAMSVAEAELSQSAAQSAALRTGMGIAAGIGLHNFSEGLAIGQAAQGGQLALAALLIIGFALHNTTEGFGIVGPLAAAEVRAPWGWLGLAGARRRWADLRGNDRRHLIQLHLPVRRLPGAGRGRAAVRHRRAPARRPPSLLGGHPVGADGRVLPRPGDRAGPRGGRRLTTRPARPLTPPDGRSTAAAGPSVAGDRSLRYSFLLCGQPR